MSVQLVFRIELTSDYHISAGHGAGALVDSALLRDADGVPVIRGTTLVGLLRKGLRELERSQALDGSHFKTVVEGLDFPNDGIREPEPADFLFGGPWRAKRWRISSARPEKLLAPQSKPNQSVLGHVGAHVRVDPALRRASAHQLFWREEGDSRLVFVFTVSCLEPSLEMTSEAALLVAAARMVRFVGANSRRGRGACSICLHEVIGWPESQFKGDQEGLLTLFEHYWLKGQRITKQLSPLRGVSSEIRTLFEDKKSELIRLGVLVRIDEPVVVSRRAAAGNQYDGLDYLPGTVLRGALASRMSARYDFSKSDVYEIFLRLFCRPAVRLSPLYPGYKARNSLYPTIPAPLNLFVGEDHPRKKLLDEEHTVYGAQEAVQCFLAPDNQLKLDNLAGSYLGMRRDMPIIKGERVREMHVTINPETGRAKDQELFGFVALAVGQYFCGEFYFEERSEWEAFRLLLDLPEVPKAPEGKRGKLSQVATLRLGKAMRRGYGKVSLMLWEQSEESLFAGAALSSRVKSVKQPLVMSLISDAIVTDAWGRSYQGFEADWLSECLGLEVRIVPHEGAGMTFPLRFAKSKVIDGFNNPIGLARQRDIALAAGSAVTLEVVEGDKYSHDVLIEKLSKVECDGIGLRRHEGFGHVVFNHPLYKMGKMGEVGNARFAKAIRIPDALRLGSGRSETYEARRQAFKEQWAEKLDGTALGKVRMAEFEGVAREIHSGWVGSLTQGRALLASYGRVEHLLTEGLLGRKKEDFFASQKGKAGLAVLSDLFVELEGYAGENKQLWQVGCRMLASRLLEKKKKEEGNS